MNLFEKILSRKEFEERPVVLIDIGASGDLRKEWETIAAYSICIAFDADSRDFGYIEKKSEFYKKLIVVNAIVTSEYVERANFYLTSSPHCSSLLPPDTEKLKPWVFKQLFDVEKKVELNAVNLAKVLSELRINYVDWFKTDSQGTDLRLFKSIGDENINNCLTVDFEPGIIDAYQGEDKLHHVLKYMDEKPFWVTDMEIKGVARMESGEFVGSLNQSEFDYLQRNSKISPCWCEISYLNDFNNSNLGIREHLLGCIIGITKQQYPFVFQLAKNGYQKFKDNDFKIIEDIIISSMKNTAKRAN